MYGRQGDKDGAPGTAKKRWLFKNDAYLMYENRNFLTTLVNGRKSDAYYRSRGVFPVSYTHLTLPTIYSV